jgi:hypothetical protein
LLLAVVPALGALHVNAQADQTPKEQYTAISQDFVKEQIEWQKLYTAAKTDEERKELLDKRPTTGPTAEKMLQLAEKYPKDAVAFDALAWVLNAASGTKPAEKALDLITKNYLAEPQLVKVLPVFARPASGNDKLLQTIFEKNPDQAVKGLASFYLAQNLKNQADTAERQKKADVAADFMKRAEALFERVDKDFGDVKDPADTKEKRRTLRDLVEPQLFELRFLVVGKTAPDIEAPDLEGKTFKLSDYRGKVVLLDFWGHW